MTKHIILVGDSIFDNGIYVNLDEPNVTEQVQKLLEDEDQVSLLAVDGDITVDISQQLEKLPDDATHLFISIGGNDALGILQSFSNPIANLGEGFHQFYGIRQEFENSYGQMVSKVLSYDLPTIFCTIYNPCFNHSELERVADYILEGTSNMVLQKMAMSALPTFNDIIFQEAAKAGVPVMDLRLIFNEDSDYANPIEPSAAGGLKIAKIIKEIVYNHDFSLKNTVIFV